MIGFEIIASDKTYNMCNSDFGSLSIHLILKSKENEENTIFIESGGLDATNQFFFNYEDINLKLGDKVIIKIKEIQERDQPVRIEDVGKTMKALTVEDDLRSYWELKEKLEKKGLI